MRGVGVLPVGVKTGVWLVAGTRVGEPYPCRCSVVRKCRTSGAVPWQCPDVGRTDTQHLPVHCCARRGEPVTETVVPDYGDDEGSDE